jgi:hypothetical protein
MDFISSSSIPQHSIHSHFQQHRASISSSSNADSSHGNAEEGRSYGGFVLLGNGAAREQEWRPNEPNPGPRMSGGALAWKCYAPIEGDDSSAAAELRNITTSIKYVVAMRTLMADLDVGLAPTKPTTIFTDAQAVVDGHMGERMPKASRWLGTRYAMIRYGEAAGTITLCKIGADHNCADIFTKRLTGEAFFRNRARVLGLPYCAEEHPAEAAGSLTVALPPIAKSPPQYALCQGKPLHEI